MLKISVTENRSQRRLVLEGRLIAPWTAEVRRAHEHALRDLRGRELVVDLDNVIAVSHEGENVLFELMGDGAKFRCGGVFMKHLLEQLAIRMRKELEETTQ